MTKIHCDICEKKYPDHIGPEGPGKWFTLAAGMGDRELRIFLFPLGVHLKEPHESLHHACSVEHMLEFTARWSERKR